MRILVIADLHLDLWDQARRDPFGPLLPILQTLDAIIVAGDLANDPMRNWPKALARLGRLLDPTKIWIIPGNHDYYQWRLSGDDGLRGLVQQAGMNFAQKASFELGGVRFLCCTLWTDFQLHGEPQLSMAAAQRAMNDYVQIARDGLSPERILPEDTLRVHREHRFWLAYELRKPFSGRTVVVTHHCPSPLALGPGNRLAPAFCSNLDSWMSISPPALWLFGHTHRRLCGRGSDTSIVNVSLGYPREVSHHEIVDVVIRGVIDTDLPDLLAYVKIGECPSHRPRSRRAPPPGRRSSWIQHGQQRRQMRRGQ